MTIEIQTALEARLQEVARRERLSVPQLVERILSQYLGGEAPDERAWVTVTQKQLVKVWPAESFKDWNPPSRYPGQHCDR